MPTPPDQNIPPVRKVKPLRVTLPNALLASVPAVCDVAGWVLARVKNATVWTAERARTMLLRAQNLRRGREELTFWWNRYQRGLKLPVLGRLATALDYLGAGATAIGDFTNSAKSSVAGKVYDAAVGGTTDLVVGGTWFPKLGGSPSVAVWDTVAELAAKGGGLSSAVKGVLQGYPVLWADPLKFREEVQKNTYGAHLRLLAGYTDFFGDGGDSKILEDFHREARSGNLGFGLQGIAMLGNGVSGLGSTGVATASVRYADEVVNWARTGDTKGLERGMEQLADQIRLGDLGHVTQAMLYFHEHVMMGGVRDNGGRLFGQ
jgi:hypothetical protein